MTTQGKAFINTYVVVAHKHFISVSPGQFGIRTKFPCLMCVFFSASESGSLEIVKESKKPIEKWPHFLAFDLNSGSKLMCWNNFDIVTLGRIRKKNLLILILP